MMVLIALFGSPQNMRAVTPPRDGGYPGRNTAEGQDALFNLTTGSANTAIGYQSLHSVTTSSGNTAVGDLTLASSNSINGVGSTAVGDHALAMSDSPFANIAIGAYGLGINVTGNSNVGVGASIVILQETSMSPSETPLSAITRPDPITPPLATRRSLAMSVGLGTARLATTPWTYNTAGHRNIAIGEGAMKLGDNGSENIGLGYFALYHNTGSYNTALGRSALRHNSTGSRNVAIGSNAGLNLTSGSYNIDIGNVGVAEEAGIIRIGTDGKQTAAYISGIATSALGTAVAVGVTPTGQLGVIGSSARYKESIKPLAEASEALFLLKPVSFRYKKEIDPAGTSQFGLVAEDVEQIDPDLVVRDKQGKPYSVRYEAVNAMLLNEFLKEHKTVQQQAATIASMQEQMETLISGLEKVSAQLELSRPTPQTVQTSQ
jgi:hypothetical protein